jgi:hypothetical protein
MQDLTKDSTHLAVGSAAQLFLDNTILEGIQNVTRRWYQPTRRGDGPVIKRDRPWEHVTYFTYSNYAVLRDPIDGLIKCWYEDLELLPAERWGPGHTMGNHHSSQLYAYSEDGVRFIKPELDICDVDGQRTNIVLGSPPYGDVHSTSVIIDPYPSEPEARFRAIYTRMNFTPDGRKESTIARSPDGIHWQPYSARPEFGFSGHHLGDVSVLFYDDESREFVQNTRHGYYGSGALDDRHPTYVSFLRPYELDNWAAQNKRRIFQTRSHDFIHWTTPVLIAAAEDDFDNLDDSYYGMCQYRVGTTHIGLVGVFHQVDNTREVQMLVSRDGIRWRRANKGQPFLAPRGLGHWDANMQSIVSPPIEMGDELWFYHGASRSTHDFWMTPWEGHGHPEAETPGVGEFALGLAVLRKDGYASLDVNPYRRGMMTTRPLIVEGDRLSINARCRPGGSVRVALASSSGQVYPGYDADSVDPFIGDAVSHTVTWRGSSELPQSRSLRLHITLQNAELFSFRFHG